MPFRRQMERLPCWLSMHKRKLLAEPVLAVSHSRTYSWDRVNPLSNTVKNSWLASIYHFPKRGKPPASSGLCDLKGSLCPSSTLQSGLNEKTTYSASFALLWVPVDPLRGVAPKQ